MQWPQVLGIVLYASLWILGATALVKRHYGSPAARGIASVILGAGWASHLLLMDWMGLLGSDQDFVWGVVVLTFITFSVGMWIALTARGGKAGDG